MAVQVKLFPTGEQEDKSMGPHDDVDVHSALEALRNEMEQLKTSVSDFATRQAQQARAFAGESTEQLKGSIVRNPATALGVALFLGVGLGLLLTSPRREKNWSDTLEDYRKSVPDVDVRKLLAKLQRQASDATESATSSFMPSLERLANSISSIDTEDTVGPALEKGTNWIKSVWKSFTK